jgi:hypothetical protein
MFLSRALGLGKEHTMLDEAIGVITSKIDEQNEGGTTTEVTLPEATGEAMLSHTTPLNQMPEELQKDLIEAFRTINRDRLELGEDLLDPMALELDDAAILQNLAFKNFVKLGLFSSVRKAIDKYNKKTGRTAAPVEPKIEVKTEEKVPETKVASVGVVMTRKIRKTLIEDMGYSREDVQKMTVEEANRLVAENITKESATLKVQQAEITQVEGKIDRMKDLQKQVKDKITAVKNLEDLEEFEIFMQDILQDPEDRALLNLTGEALDNLIADTKKALTQLVNFDALIVGETVVMADPKMKNMMTIIEKTATEIKMRPFGQVTGAIAIVTKKQVDEDRVVKYRYSPDMKKTLAREALTSQEVEESNTAVENVKTDDRSKTEDAFKTASEKSGAEITKGFLDDLNNCQK